MLTKTTVIRDFAPSEDAADTESENVHLQIGHLRDQAKKNRHQMSEYKDCK